MTCTSFLFCTITEAQSSWKFRSSEWLGIVQGEMGAYGQVQSVNGLYHRSWFIGAGIGLDNYRYRSIPLFLSVTRGLLHVGARHSLFAGLDGGTNFPWCRYQLPYTFPSSYSTFHPGLYWNARIGYRFNLSEQHGQALLFSAGYSYKALREDRPTIPKNTYEYYNRRVSLLVGWQF